MSLTIVEKKSSSEGDSGARKERRAECRGLFGGFVAMFPLERKLQSILSGVCCFELAIRKGLTVSRLCGVLLDKLFETQKMRSCDFWTVELMGYLGKKRTRG